MNRRGQTIMLTVIIGIFIYLFGSLFIFFLDTESKNAAGTNSTYAGPSPNLNCGTSSDPNQNVSDGTKLTCLATDAVVPYFILALISTAGGLIIAKLLK